MHLNGPIIVFVLCINGLSLVNLVEQESQRGVSDYLRWIISQLADEYYLFWSLYSCKGSLSALELLVLEGSSC